LADNEVNFGFKKVKMSEKPRLVNDVFSGVANNYDIMNDVMSLGIHRIWKNLMMDWLAPRPGQNLIDVAGGTGDIGKRFLDRCKGNAEVKIVDFTQEMISFGKRKTEDYRYKNQLAWFCADAMRLPFSNNNFHSYTISFGLRNVLDINKALEEAYRVLRPGGRILILEFSTLIDKNLQRLYDKYSFGVIPWLGKVIAKDKESYQYLVESIRNFPKQNELVDLMISAGFKEVKYRNLSMGIVALHSGWKL
jgi:demethylmenaquinone methyltransferase/2-methoxy-6-polyprenyl-1,4-benzoquinol methylase|tara:strand:- start:655 stop:1401 length:747 start_codon:yes stop_codon:yes gene_type:complete